MPRFVATAPPGLAELLAEELRALGAAEVGVSGAQTGFSGPLETAYRACLWSRVANRVLLPLASFPAPDADALYEGARGVLWREHLAAAGTVAVDCRLRRARLRDARFAAVRVKDAIADQFREALGVRPSVDRHDPDLRVAVRVDRDTATLCVDLSGTSLHRRGYREPGAAAPMKENVAAAVLARAGWAAIAARGGALLDPMCGSGTLPIEAALAAGDVAPGLGRGAHGFERWAGHDPALWSALLAEAHERRAAGLARLPPIAGHDADPGMVRLARRHVDAAGLGGRVRIERRALDAARAPDAPPGLVVLNPPYGHRLGDAASLGDLYARIGEVLRTRFAGWDAAVLTGEPGLGRRIGLRPKRVNRIRNGALDCRLLRFEIEGGERGRRGTRS